MVIPIIPEKHNQNVDFDQTEWCGSIETQRKEFRLNPLSRWYQRQIEFDISSWLSNHDTSTARTGIIYIPVVVHVIWKKNEEEEKEGIADEKSEQYISDAQIRSQIDVLKQDFRMTTLNLDKPSKPEDKPITPDKFRKFGADTRIEFRLAKRDPNCMDTTGITRKQTNKDSWSFWNDDMKKESEGGVDPWDTKKYLNIWVVNLVKGQSGHGTSPAVENLGNRRNARISGIICDYKYFGNKGTIEKGNLGHTVTHEVGHYLNLLHIWGNKHYKAKDCTDSDKIEDTPNQEKANFAIDKNNPPSSCGNSGDMFMNFMDYTDDKYMTMFTLGQANQMISTLETQRASLLDSNGLIPVSPAEELVPDLWIQDSPQDTGLEPNPSRQPMYISNDIWVRTKTSGLSNQDHENPKFGQSNYVYVRVRNLGGCKGGAHGTLKLYWAKASTSLAWPKPWDGSVKKPAPMGGIIGSQDVEVDANGSEIVEFAWQPPNPDDYASFGADKGHFCLLARIETESEQPYGMSSPETLSLWNNVKNNNNIAWKNVSIIKEQKDSEISSQVVATSYIDDIDEARFLFSIPEDEGLTVFDWGEVFVELPPALSSQPTLEEFLEGPIERIDEHIFQILEPGALIGPVILEKGRIDTLQIRFKPIAHEPMGAQVLTLDLIQLRGQEPVGGQRLLLKTSVDLSGLGLDNIDSIDNGVETIPLGSDCCC